MLKFIKDRRKDIKQFWKIPEFPVKKKTTKHEPWKSSLALKSTDAAGDCDHVASELNFADTRFIATASCWHTVFFSFHPRVWFQLSHYVYLTRMQKCSRWHETFWWEILAGVYGLTCAAFAFHELLDVCKRFPASQSLHRRKFVFLFLKSLLCIKILPCDKWGEHDFYSG